MVVSNGRYPTVKNRKFSNVSRRRDARRSRRRGWRSCQFEPLEDRLPLATDVLVAGSLELGEGEGELDDLVAVHLSTTDLSGNPISSVAAGQRFLLQGHVEDLRLDAAGVFAAYLDIEFDSTHAEVLGPLVHGADFQNGASGEFGLGGLIDEVGGFQSRLAPPGVANHDLFSVTVMAGGVGTLVFESSPADVLPDHSVLLYGINHEIVDSQIAFGRVAIEVTPGDGTVVMDAVDDAFDVAANGSDVRLDVLANDSGAGRLAVESITAGDLVGDVSISTDGLAVQYSPGPGFVGSEQFEYLAVDENGATDRATVTVQVRAAEPQEDLVAIRLEATDLFGNPITSVAAAGDFLLHAYVEDTRVDAGGVFAAYLDLLYDPAAVEVSGGIDFGEGYVNATSGSVETPGLIDEVGAFHESLRPVGGGEARLFTVRFTATGNGPVEFQSDPADRFPDHVLLLYGLNEPVSIDQSVFGGLRLEVEADVTAVDDSFHIPHAGSSFLDVLNNDLQRSTEPLRIREVDTSGLRGTVQLAADGLALTYHPPDAFQGTEQFSYAVAGERGADWAQVTVHATPGSEQDDVVAIDLATLDLQGNPIQTIAAGQEFWLTATVADLRQPGLSDPLSGDDLGVFAAYFDLLYDADQVSVVATDANTLGFDTEFGEAYLNGRNGDATIPGVIDEIGAFQSDTQPLGSEPQRLFAVRLRAAGGVSGASFFDVREDAQGVALDVLADYQPNSGRTDFRSDPSDLRPLSDVLLYEPPEVVGPAGIAFGTAELQIVENTLPLITSVSSPSAGGSAVVSSDGQRIEYTPAPDFNGLETFSYSIDHGPPIPVTVTVDAVPDAPRATDDQYHVRANHRLSVDAASGLLANDQDADGDALQVVAAQGPSHGSLVTAEDGAFVYVPQPGYVGPDQFTYQASDGVLTSSVATVSIFVEPPPVRVRLEALGVDGLPRIQYQAGESVFLQALIQDRRGDPSTIHGVGAAYLDVVFDAEQIRPAPTPEGPFDVAIEFGEHYQNGTKVAVDADGLDEVGAFQTDLTPVGPEELELFTVELELDGLELVPDEFAVSGNSRVNRLDVLANEVGLTWEVPLGANGSDEHPLNDVVLFDPPVALAEEDIAFLGTVLTVSNGSHLTITQAGHSTDGRTRQGGTVAVNAGGTGIDYAPPLGFSGLDTFEYTVVAENGAVGTASVAVTVVSSWQNRFHRYDVNSDGLVSSTDVRLLVNDLNRSRARLLPTPFAGPHFFDVNDDGFASPQDVLSVLNYINRQTIVSPAEGEAPLRVEEDQVLARDAGSLLATASNSAGTLLSLPEAHVLISRLPDVVSDVASAFDQEAWGSALQATAEEVASLHDRLRSAADRLQPGEVDQIVDELVADWEDFVDELALAWGSAN